MYDINLFNIKNIFFVNEDHLQKNQCYFVYFLANNEYLIKIIYDLSFDLFSA